MERNPDPLGNDNCSSIQLAKCENVWEYYTEILHGKWRGIVTRRDLAINSRFRVLEFRTNRWSHILEKVTIMRTVINGG